MSIYVDSSFLVSLYLSDRHSHAARQRIRSIPPLWFTPLHNSEWAHAIGQHIFRGELSLSEAQRMNARREEHVLARRWISLPMPEDAFELCADLARRYGAKLGMRTLDSCMSPARWNSKRNNFGRLMSGREAGESRGAED